MRIRLRRWDVTGKSNIPFLLDQGKSRWGPNSFAKVRRAILTNEKRGIRALGRMSIRHDVRMFSKIECGPDLIDFQLLLTKVIPTFVVNLHHDVPAADDNQVIREIKIHACNK